MTLSDTPGQTKLFAAVFLKGLQNDKFYYIMKLLPKWSAMYCEILIISLMLLRRLWAHSERCIFQINQASNGLVSHICKVMLCLPFLEKIFSIYGKKCLLVSMLSGKTGLLTIILGTYNSVCKIKPQDSLIFRQWAPTPAILYSGGESTRCQSLLCSYSGNL